MNDTKPSGGPAFTIPHTIADANDPAFKRGNGGMSLRDYFAGKALEALIARDADDSAYGTDMIKARPQIAFEYADAMIAARNS